MLKERLTKRQELIENIDKLNRSMIIEIFILIYFITSVLLGINLWVTVIITIALFSYEEFRIKKTKDRIGFNKKGNTFRILGVIIALIGLILLISSPLFIKMLVQLAIPITLIVAGAAIFVIAKFYDKPKVDLKSLRSKVEFY